MAETNKTNDDDKTSITPSNKQNTINSQTSQSSLFKRMKNYIVLGMLILIFLNTAIVTLKVHIFGGDSNQGINSASASLIAAERILQIVPKLGAIQSNSDFPTSLLSSNFTLA